MAHCASRAEKNPDGTVYGQWFEAGGEPRFHYVGPVVSPQITTQGEASVPLQLFGNDAWSAFADTRGRVGFFLRTGGPMWLGHPNPDRGRPGSGWGTWTDSTGARIARRDAEPKPGAAVFTHRSVSFESNSDGLHVTQSLHFPAGVELAAEKEVRIEQTPNRQGTWTDVWDLTPQPLLAALLIGGSITRSVEDSRLRWNNRYRFNTRQVDRREVRVDIDALESEATKPPADFGSYPRQLTLRSLDADIESFELKPPLVISLNVPTPSGSRPLTLRFRLEVTPAGGTEPAPSKGPRGPRDIVEFRGPEVPSWLTREIQWHSGQIAASAAYDGAFHETFVDQGSAYLYLQGLSGAVRDYVLHALALIPTRPDLARGNLRVAMRFTQSDGHITYGSFGFGNLTDAGIRDESTDLDIFLLWGLARYVLETRDFGFLDEIVPFADKGESTVRHRIELAFSHLMNVTQTGPNGWIRVGTGDWSDGIILFSKDPILTRAKGESFFNTAMALAVLPRSIELVGQWNPVVAIVAQSWLESMRTAARSAWSGRWYVRGSFGDGSVLGADRIFLESNLFALWAGLGDEVQRATLTQALDEQLDRDEPLGARNVFPPAEVAGELLKPGWDVNGGTWAALNGLLALAYTSIDPLRAWKSFLEGSLHQHEITYPNIWYGIWTGPDSYNASYAERPGETFVHIATSMADFPAANMNVHSGPLMALDDLVGIQPLAEGIHIRPSLPLKEWSYRSAVLSIQWGKNAVTLDYHLDHPSTDLWRITYPSHWGAVCDPSGNRIADAGRGEVVIPLEEAELRPCPQSIR